MPSSWDLLRLGSWYLACHSSLPIVMINGPDQASPSPPIGCFLGYVLDDQGRRLLPGDVAIVPPTAQASDGELERWIYRHGGRWIAVMSAGNIQRIYLDPFGSLSMAYCPELELAASTPSLIPRRGNSARMTELAMRIGIPYRSAMYPLRLTPREGIFHLVPNHFLDLNRWQPVRHWPTAWPALVGDPHAALETIVRIARRQIAGLVSRGPALVRLTAGYDSRTVLACAREVSDRITVMTAEHEYPDEPAWADCATAGRIARDNRLQHLRLRFVPPTKEDLDAWVERTGRSIGEYRGWRACTTYRQLPGDRPDLIPMGTAIMRSPFRSPGDDEHTCIRPDRLVRMCGIAGDPSAEPVFAEWLATLPTRDPLLTLDLFGIEQRLGAWAGIYPYGFWDRGRYQVFPFCRREIVESILAIPASLRRNGRLQTEIIGQCWPRLLKHPFNRTIGRDRAGLWWYRARGRPRAIARRVFRTLRDPIDAVQRIQRRLRTRGGP